MANAGFKKGKDGKTAADLLAELGPTVLVNIGLKPKSSHSGAPDLAKKGVRALLDTGAGGDCIDDELARALQLPIIETGEISGIGGRHEAHIYLARVYVPSLKRMVFQQFAGVKLQEGDQWHRVILGRTFLRPYKITYDGGSGSVEIELISDQA